MKQRVQILCTGNSARSQMAEGLLRALAGEYFVVFSAGSNPSTVNPLAVAAMDERGIDIRSHRSKHLREYLAQPFEYVITVCDSAAESCPIFPGQAQRIHWSFPDQRYSMCLGEHNAAIIACRMSLTDTLYNQLRLFGSPRVSVYEPQFGPASNKTRSYAMKPDQSTTPAKQPSALAPSDVVIPITTPQPAEAAACCSPTTQASCCAPAAKSACCGTSGTQCGCR